MIPRAHERRELLLLLALALVARLVAWPFVDGFVMPDEYFQSLEPAHHLVYGHGVLAWEWEVGIRSWAVPYAYSALFRIADLVGLAGPGDLPRVAQLANLLLSLLVVSSSWRLGRTAGRTCALVAGALAAVFAPLLFFAPRTLLDCGSAAFLVAALARFAEATPSGDGTAEPPARRALLTAGLLLGVAYVFRYTAPIFFIGPALFLLARRDRAGLAQLALGFTLVFVAVGALDWLTWGRPFHSLVAYLSFNVVEGHSARYGVESPAWYLTTLVAQLGPLWFLSLALGVLGLARRGPLGACALGLAIGLSAMSVIAHKEERFLLPVLALLPPFFALGFARLRARLHRVGPRAPVAAWACLLLAFGSSWLAWSRRDFSPNVGWLDAMRWVGAHDEVHGVLATTGWASLGGDVVHRRNLPILGNARLSERQLAPSPIFDTLVTDLGTLARAGWHPGAPLSGLSEVARFDDVVVMRRPPSR